MSKICSDTYSDTFVYMSLFMGCLYAKIMFKTEKGLILEWRLLQVFKSKPFFLYIRIFWRGAYIYKHIQSIA